MCTISILKTIYINNQSVFESLNIERYIHFSTLFIGIKRPLSRDKIMEISGECSKFIFQDCDPQWMIKKLKSQEWIARSNFLKFKTKILLSASNNLKMKTVIYKCEFVCRTREWPKWRLSRRQTFKDYIIVYKITYLVLQVHLAHTIPKINSHFLACKLLYSSVYFWNNLIMHG